MGPGSHGARYVEQTAGGCELPCEQRRAPRVEIRVARERRVKRLELPRSLEQKRGTLAATIVGESQLSLQQTQACPSELIQRPGLRGLDQRERGVERAGLQAGLCCGEQAFGAAGRIDGQVGCAAQERRRRGEAAAALRAVGGPLELVGDLLVRPLSGVRAVPGTAIRFETGVGHLRQRCVRAPALALRRRPIDGRPHQRMPEANLRPDVEQAVLGRGRDRRVRDPEPLGGAPHDRRISSRFRRRDQEQEPRLLGQLVEPALETLLDPARQRDQIRHPEPPGQLGGRKPSRELQQRERVPPGLGDDPVANAVVEAAGDDGRKQGARIFVVQPVEEKLRQAAQLRRRAGLAHGEHERDGFRKEAPGHEPEYLARGFVQPLGVLDDAEKRLFVGDPGEEGQGPERHEETVGWIPGREPEGDTQGPLLRWRQAVEPAEHRCEELMESRKRQLHLRFDPGDLSDIETRSLCGDLLQQRRLADPRLAPDDQDGAPPTARVPQKPLERLALAQPVAKPPVVGHGPTITPLGPLSAPLDAPASVLLERETLEHTEAYELAGGPRRRSTQSRRRRPAPPSRPVDETRGFHGRDPGAAKPSSSACPTRVQRARTNERPNPCQRSSPLSPEPSPAAGSAASSVSWLPSS